MLPPSHIATLGMSFSGSTILNYCLGSLPDCATINESHWLIDAHPTGRTPPCRMCGSNCRVLTDEFRTELKGAADFYERVRARLGVRTLISSDKTLKIYDRLAPSRDYSAIIIFKDPRYQLNSWRSAMQRKSRKEDAKQFLRYYEKYYRKLMDAPIRGKKMYVACQSFQRSPLITLRSICSYFELPYDVSALDYWEYAHHSIGGNFNPFSRLEQDGIEAVRIKNLRPKTFSPEIVDLCRADGPSNAIYEEMASRAQNAG